MVNLRMPQENREEIILEFSDGRKFSAAIKRYRSAKHIRLRLENDGSIIISAPKRFSLSRIRSVTSDILPRLEKVFDKLAIQKPDIPEYIYWPPENRRFLIREQTALPSDLPSLKCIHPAAENECPVLLLLHSSLNDGVKTLQNFFRPKATVFLRDFIHSLPAPTPFDFRVANQRKRMGSCSRKKNLSTPCVARPVISLNWRSAFLDRRLLTHLCFHEFAHLLQMNHSPLFYQTLESFSPASKTLEKELLAAWRKLPYWIAAHP